MEGVLTTVDPSASASDGFADEPMSNRADRFDSAAPQSGSTERSNGDAAGEAAPEIVPMRVVEAILFASDVPLPPSKIANVLGVGDARDVRKHIAALNAEYAETGRSFRIEEIAGGFQMLTQPAYNRWLAKLLRARQETKLTGASMETLAIVAYKQPVTRADIEAIRGVAAGDLLNRLREMNLVKIVGRAEDLGRPLLYGTTKRFLEVFGLAGLEDLPEVDALRMAGSGGAASALDGIGHHKIAEDSVEPEAPTTAAPSASAESEAELSMDRSVELDTEANESPPVNLPFMASADLHPADSPSLQHPPLKAVVTKRRRSKPKASEQSNPGENGDSNAADSA